MKANNRLALTTCVWVAGFVFAQLVLTTARSQERGIEPPEVGQPPGGPERQSADAPATLEIVTVTGTHLAGTNFESPTPLTSVGAERLESLAIANVAEALLEMPSFRATWSQ